MKTRRERQLAGGFFGNRHGDDAAVGLGAEAVFHRDRTEEAKRLIR